MLFLIEFLYSYGAHKNIQTNYYLLGLFKIIKAAITPGAQPQSHKIKVIRIEPQPLSKTAKGGQIIESITRQKLII